MQKQGALDGIKTFYKYKLMGNFGIFPIFIRNQRGNPMKELLGKLYLKQALELV
ncbi:MAG: hypothetical protein SPJ16_07400 [Helicobacter sp.]|uniref:hypothetical protein n=1 Tax=Helicobacter sp. TaxID=218 RepID=UPI002A9183F4|nr:hypothetical protein [Helicobacter sp.]MDY5950995.1 hypothetical protein [Helicobacter sp.]